MAEEAKQNVEAESNESNDLNTDSNRQRLQNQAYVKENLTPWEQKMLGMDAPAEETQEEKPAQQKEESSEPEKNTDVPKTTEETKADAKSILEKLLKGKEDSAEPEKKNEPAPKEEKEVDEEDPIVKENKELKVKMQIIEESEKIEELLSAYPEKESVVLKDRLIELLGSKIYGTMHKLPTEEKIASLITMAKGLAADDIKALAEDSADAKKLLEDATQTPRGSSKQTDQEAIRVKQLKEAARNGDRRAMIELQKHDPILNQLAGN